MKNNPRTNTIAQIQKTTWQDVPESGLRYHYHTDIPDYYYQLWYTTALYKPVQVQQQKGNFRVLYAKSTPP